MKLTTLMLIFFCMHISAATFGQQISLSLKKVSAETVFNKIEQQTKYSFFYTSEALKQLPQITIDVKNASVEQVLDKCLKNSSLSYSIVANVIVIKAKVTAANVSVADSRVIIGRVLDDKGNPIPGVTVKSKGSAQGTVTNTSGQFTLLLDNFDAAILQFSFIGYTTRELKANDVARLFDVKLTEDIARLDEVKVVAYGTTTKRLSTGDQTSISATDIAKYPTNNVLDVLQGSVPGLVVVKNTGNANSTYRVQLRGINGTSSRAPLYVVDGVPYEGGNYATRNTTLGGQGVPNSAGGGGDALSFINPLDIESITVLKDASATSIYGTRAADGVIIITTKKGKPGSLKTDVSFYTGYTSVSHFPDMLDLKQYLQMRKEAKRNDNAVIGAADYDINGVWDTTRSTNWAKTLIGGTGHLTNVQVGISGGSDNTQYRISTGYSRQTNIGDLAGSNQTANLNFNVTSKTTDNKFSVQLNGSYFYNMNTITQADLTASLVLAPDAPALYNPDGTLNFQNNTFDNPLVAKNFLNNTKGTNLTSSAVISYRPINNLEFKATLGYNRQDVNEFLGTPSTSVAPFRTQSPYSTFTNSNKSWWSIEPQANYNQDISKGKLTLTVGSSLQQNVNESTGLQASGYSSDLLLHSISAATTIVSSQPYSYLPYKLSGLFGRAGFNWDNKYLLDVSARYDGSSHFGQDRQFHLFSAVGAAWIFSEESLIKNNLGFLSYGKVRGSYGVTGRDAIAPYQYMDTFSSGQPYQAVPGLVPSGLPNAELSWESTTKSEIALELQFFNGRIGFETNIYRNQTTNLLVSSPLSTVTGFSTFLRNLPANIQNQGFDVSLTGYSVRNKNLSWSTTLLFTRERNAVLSYPGLDKSPDASQYIVGQPVSLLRVFNFAGVNPQTGVYQFYSKSGTIISSPVSGTDNTTIINTNPDYYGSLRNSIRYKQFTLDFLFRFIKQIGKNAFGQEPTVPPGFSANTNYSTIVLNRWQKPGDITDQQRYGTNFTLLLAQLSASQSDHAYGDASYIRFQNLALTYDFTQAALKRLHVQNLSIYIQGENLLTISRYGAIDPENQFTGILPPLRTLTTGLRLTL